MTLCAALSATSSACATLPEGRLSVREVRVKGASEISEGDVVDRLSTQADSTVLSDPVALTTQYETYDRFVVERDVQRLERFYRSKGFHEAKVWAGRVRKRGERHVEVEFHVDEGERTLVSLVKIKRLREPTREAGRALGKAETLLVGQPFDEERYSSMKVGLLKALSDNGHAHAELRGGFIEDDLQPTAGEPAPIDPLRDTEAVVRYQKHRAESAKPQQRVHVQPDAHAHGNGNGTAEPPPATERRHGVRVDVLRHSAEIFLEVDPGPECRFGEIRIDGLGDLPEAQVRAALGLSRGQRYSTSELESGRLSLLELGVFSSVEYAVELPEDREVADIPVTFRVTLAPLHTVTLGGGLQSDVLETDVHFFAGYEHQNFLGGLRRLQMQARPGVVLFPSNLQNLLPPERPLFELRSRAEVRQPQLFEARTRGTLRSEFLVYPYTLPARALAEVPNVVVGYRELRESAGLDRTFFGGKLSLSTFYNFQLSDPFSYFGPLDQGIQRVIVSYLSFGQALDLRDNPLKPRRGAFFANEVQVAGGALQGDASDVKVQPDVRFYAPISKRVTLASRASVGFLFPRSYGDTLDQVSPDSTTDPFGAFQFQAQRNRDLQLLFFRAFFSGGPNANRGYALRAVGPWGVAPFRLGNTALRDCQGRVPVGTGVAGTAAQAALLPEIDPAICSVPLGGLSLWEWSIEIRFRITDNLSTLLFVDASDVTRQQFKLRIDYPHLSTGTGLRYDTAVGPVRVDVGYAVPGLQRIGGELDPLTEGQSATVLGLPIALNIAIGEAF